MDAIQSDTSLGSHRTRPPGLRTCFDRVLESDWPRYEGQPDCISFPGTFARCVHVQARRAQGRCRQRRGRAEDSCWNRQARHAGDAALGRVRPSCRRKLHTNSVAGFGRRPSAYPATGLRLAPRFACRTAFSQRDRSDFVVSWPFQCANGPASQGSGLESASALVASGWQRLTGCPTAPSWALFFPERCWLWVFPDWLPPFPPLVVGAMRDSTRKQASWLSPFGVHQTMHRHLTHSSTKWRCKCSRSTQRPNHDPHANYRHATRVRMRRVDWVD